MLIDSLLSALIAAVGTLIIWLVTHSLWSLLPGALLFIAMYLLLARRRQHHQQERLETENKARPAQVLAQIQSQIGQMGEACQAIQGPEVCAKIEDLQKPLTGMWEFLRDHPDKLARVRGLHDHYLPGLLQALDIYRRSEPYGLCDKEKLLEYLSAMQLAFENLLRQLFADSLASMDSTMAVAVRLLKESGLDHPPEAPLAQERSTL